MTRPLDKHLDSDELDRLVSLQETSVSDSEQLSESTLREVQRHVESCQDCSRKLQRHQFVHGQILRMRVPGPSPSTSACMGDAGWREVAAGLLPEAKTRELMKHAAQCGQCGPLLKNAAEALVDEATPGEETLLASLQSARPEWRKNMAATLRDNVRDRQAKPSWWRAIFAWPTPAYAFAGIVAVAVVAWIGVRALHPVSAEQLLAQAYSEHRTLEVRISGAQFAPMQVERSIARSNLDKPTSLLKAEALIAAELQRNPEAPRWLEAKARADLLDGNYESAISELRQALETQPDSPSLLTDLASAYFGRAESADRAIDYGNAIEALGKALAKSPDDAVALFNRALIYEKVPMYHEALIDWEHYLRVDSNSAWSAEAKRHADQIRSRLQQHDQSLATPLMDEGEFAARVNPRDENTWTNIDSRIDDYLDLAIRKWLPTAYGPVSNDTAHDSRESALKALQTLSIILNAKHHDSWLSDFMQAGSSPRLMTATRELSHAVEANEAGSPLQAREKSIKAQLAFDSADNPPGAMRAKLEEVYSLHRLFRGPECLRIAAQLADRIVGQHYSWLFTQLQLEKFSCLASEAKIDRGENVISKALDVATTSGYDTLLLRAIGFQAVLENEKSDLVAASTWDRTGLSRYWTGTHAPMRAYQYYDDWSDQAQQASNWYLSAALEHEAVLAISSTPNRSGEAMAHFQLARSLSRAGAEERAQAELSLARKQFSVIPADSATLGYLADSELQLANAEADGGHPEEAGDELSEARRNLPDSFDSYETWLTYYQTKAFIARTRNNSEDLDRSCRAVVALGELGLGSIKGERDRFLWNRKTSYCYRELVEGRIQEQDAAGALELWEWYRAAPIRASRNLVSTSTFRSLETDSDLPSTDMVQRHLHDLTDQTVIAYAQLPGRIVVWVFDDRGIVGLTLDVEPKQLAHMAMQFSAQCSNPKSDLTLLRRNGRVLYEWLIEPLASFVPANRSLVIEPDGVLTNFPFQALVQQDGSYWGLTREMVLSPGLGYVSRLRAAKEVNTDSTALVVGEPAVSDPPRLPLPDAGREVQQISSYFRRSVILMGKNANHREIMNKLAGANVFHFAGHATSGPLISGLEIAPDTELVDAHQRALFTPESIASARLPSLDLVVLSACSTGMSEENDLAGFENIATAFLRSGVPRVIASRWNVDSTTTSLFMATFYELLLAGHSVSESVRLASVRVNGTPNTFHPYFWAPFSIFGRG